MLRKNSKLKAGSLYLFGNLFNKAIAFLTIPIFTRLLSTSEYGIINTYISWVTIVGAFIGLSLGNSIRSAFVELKEDIDSYISSILFLSAINFAATTCLVLLIASIWSLDIKINILIFCLVQAFMTNIIDTISLKYMMDSKYFKRTLLIALPNILVTLLSIFFIVLMKNEKYMGRIWAYVIVYSIIGTSLFLYNLKKGGMLVNIVYWKYGLKFSLPLILHGLSLVLLAQSDRAMITALRNTSETGVYSLVYNFSMIALVFTASLESIWIPWFTDRLKNLDKDTINQKAKYYLQIILFICTAIMLIAPEILSIMAPVEYHWGVILIPPIVASSYFMFLNSISINLEYFYKKTKVIAINTVIVATINIGLNFLLIPKYGAIAAAFTTLVSYIISFLFHYFAAQKIDNGLFPFKLYISPLIGILLAIIASYLTMNIKYLRWGLFILVSIIFGIFVIKNKHKIFN